ncbi:MAG: hypothetical protein ACRBM6_00595 [Geminicoccales bacterium]
MAEWKKPPIPDDLLGQLLAGRDPQAVTVIANASIELSATVKISPLV